MRYLISKDDPNSMEKRSLFTHIMTSRTYVKLICAWLVDYKWTRYEWGDDDEDNNGKTLDEDEVEEEEDEYAKTLNEVPESGEISGRNGQKFSI
ncbi:hypothetical protein QVD17_04976 [Tagetes erecta]|uniref:Uncharacterized protein n=1 Tax=Tagetes erecta TaxID=13708 RepID=A0AAD8LHB8_TARER|nr:hypothetical protein QVD17_04976 [Tagetes erecta]